MTERRRALGKLWLLVICLVVLAMSVLPTLWIVATSLKPESLIAKWPPSWYSGVVSLGNYVDVFTRFPFLIWLRNSLVVAISSTALTILLGSLAGYTFARFTFRGRNPLFLLAVATIVIPQEITIIPLYISLTRGLKDGEHLCEPYPAVVANPVSIFLFKQFFDGFPSELEEAAVIDGYGRVPHLSESRAPALRGSHHGRGDPDFHGGVE